MTHKTAQSMQTGRPGSLPYRIVSTGWHFTRYLLNRRYPDRFRLLRDYLKIQFWLRVQPDRTKPLKLLGYTVHYPSLYLLRHLFNEVVLEPTYRFASRRKDPVIIDAGANVGLAMLFYKYQYPQARMICFEPDPKSFAILEQNIMANRFADVTAHNVALSDKPGSLTLYYNDDLVGDTTASISRQFRGHRQDQENISRQTVKAVTLSDYLRQPVDLLKIDIEGSEGKVFQDIGRRLGKVRAIQMEYHYDRRNNPLHPIVEALEAGGHDYQILAPGTLRSQPGSVAVIYSWLRRRRTR